MLNRFPGLLRYLVLPATLAVVAIAVVACDWFRGSSTPDDGRLNVVVVLSDALRASNLPMYGYARNTAPRLAELAHESITFDSHLAHYPGTSVSISQLHTGRLVPPLLMSYKYIAVPVRAIPPDLLILPEAFRKAGYRTGIISSHYWFRSDSELVPRFESQAIVPGVAPKSYAFFEDLWPAIVKFLDRSGEDHRPFFLYLHTLDTHGPNTCHPGLEQFCNAADWPAAYNLYDSEILYTDYWVGKLVDELRQRGLLDKTVFVFTADHGEEFNEMGPEKWNAFHGPFVRRVLMHVPLIMRIPHDPAPGRRYQAVSRHIDLAPTLLRLAVPNFDLHPYRFDGEDLSAELRSGGTGAGVERVSYAFSPRYWGIYRRDVEVHYDQWADSFSPLYAPTPDTRNYPRLEPIENPALRDQLVAQLAREQQSKTREYLDLPENPQLPQPALLALLLPVKHNGAPGPTFDNLPDDNLWHLNGSYLESQRQEHPPPVTLVTPWVSGTYRVTVVLYQPRIKQGYENQFTLAFADDGDQAVHLRGAQAKGSELDAGVHRLGKQLELQFSDPQGGVAVAGLKFERLDAPAGAVTPDDGLKEHLRALGYVE
jgi:arylsulfatase A-like enzyme